MSDNDLMQEAIDFARQAYAHHGGDRDKALHSIRQKYGGHISEKPNITDIQEQRKLELSSAHYVMSNGKFHGRVAEDRWDRAKKGLGGHSGSGNELAPSQIMALQLGDKGKEFLTDHVKKLSGQHRPRAEAEHTVKVDPSHSGQRGVARVGLLGTIATAATAVLAIGSVTKAEAKTPGFEDKKLGSQVAQVATSFTEKNIPGGKDLVGNNKASGAYQFGISVAASTLGGAVESGANAIRKGVGGGALTTSFMAVAAMTAAAQGQDIRIGIIKTLTAGQNAVEGVEGFLKRHNPFDETGPGVTKPIVGTPMMGGPGAGPF